MESCTKEITSEGLQEKTKKSSQDLEIDQENSCGNIPTALVMAKKVALDSTNESPKKETLNELKQKSASGCAELSSAPSTTKDSSFKGFPIYGDNRLKIEELVDSRNAQYIRIEKLIELPELEHDQQVFYTIAVMFTDEGDQILPKHKETFRQYELCDLHGNVFSLYLTTPWNGNTFESGMIVALVDSSVKSVYQNSKNKPNIFIDDPKQLITLGTSDTIVNCRYKEEKKRCIHLVDKNRSPFCHEHLRKEYFTVSSKTMQLNMNVGFGPVKSGGSKKAAERAGNDHYESFRDFKVASKNDSNIEKHPWYNLPDSKKVTKILATKDSIGSRYLRFNPTTAQEEARTKARNKTIPIQFRNKRKRTQEERELEQAPPAKRRRLNESEEETRQKREALLNKVRKSIKVVLK